MTDGLISLEREEKKPLTLWHNGKSGRTPDNDDLEDVSPLRHAAGGWRRSAHQGSCPSQRTRKLLHLSQAILVLLRTRAEPCWESALGGVEAIQNRTYVETERYGAFWSLSKYCDG